MIRSVLGFTLVVIISLSVSAVAFAGTVGPGCGFWPKSNSDCDTHSDPPAGFSPIRSPIDPLGTFGPGASWGGPPPYVAFSGEGVTAQTGALGRLVQSALDGGQKLTQRAITRALQIDIDRAPGSAETGRGARSAVNSDDGVPDPTDPAGRGCGECE